MIRQMAHLVKTRIRQEQEKKRRLVVAQKYLDRENQSLADQNESLYGIRADLNEQGQDLIN
jgi:hypothetical protein